MVAYLMQHPVRRLKPQSDEHESNTLTIRTMDIHKQLLAEENNDSYGIHMLGRFRENFSAIKGQILTYHVACIQSVVF